MRTRVLALLAGLIISPAFAQFYPISPGLIPFGNTARYITSYSGFLYGVTTNQLEVPAGTAALPSYTFSGSNNQTTGMYLSSTNALGFTANGAEVAQIDSNGIYTVVAGEGIGVKEGTNARMGVATLAGTTTNVSVANTSIAAGDRVFLSVATASGTQGYLSLSGVTAGVGFGVHSTSGTEASSVNWLVIKSP